MFLFNGNYFLYMLASALCCPVNQPITSIYGLRQKRTERALFPVHTLSAALQKSRFQSLMNKSVLSMLKRIFKTSILSISAVGWAHRKVFMATAAVLDKNLQYPGEIISKGECEVQIFRVFLMDHPQQQKSHKTAQADQNMAELHSSTLFHAFGWEFAN